MVSSKWPGINKNTNPDLMTLPLNTMVFRPLEAVGEKGCHVTRRGCDSLRGRIV